MQVLLLTVLLLTCFSLSNSHAVKKMNWKFLSEFVHSYLCTGKLDWWKRVNQGPMLKLLVRGAIWSNCYDHTQKLHSKETLIELIKEADTVFRQTSAIKRKEASQCLIGGIKNLYFLSFLCPGPSEEFEGMLDKSGDEGYDRKCRQKHLEGFILCRLLKWGLKYRKLTRKLFSPFVCRNSRQKRLYDVSSFMAMVNQAACWNSADNDVQKALIEDGGLDLSQGWTMFCCFSRLIDN